MNEIASTPSRMAAITGVAAVSVIANFSMISVHLIPVTVLMAGYAGKHLIVVRIGVAIRASRPFAPVRTRIDWEPLLIVQLVEVRVPVIGGMADSTVVRELSIPMVRIPHIIEVIGMTGVAICWSPAKSPIRMTGGALNLPVCSS